MTDRRRKQARVQGGWASKSSDTASRVSSDCNGGTSTAWKQTADPVKFEIQEVRPLPQTETRVLSGSGLFEISSEPSGISRLRLIPEFIEPSECDVLLDELLNALPWQQETVISNGESHLQPRLTSWFGDLPYSYSGTTHPVNSKWLPVLKDLKDRIESNTGLTFNSLLANLYRDGHDHVAWHSDDESSLGVDPIIASLSLGDSRNFELRKKEGCSSGAHTEFYKVPLDSGTLLIMDGALQRDWEHRVPREYHDRSARVNLTFRTILPD